MIREEFKKIKSNKLLMSTVIVVSFLPIIYAGVFLKSLWDPYGHLNNLPVAVVNEDRAADFEGQKLDVGDQVVANLKKNELLDWNFVSAEEAQEGLKDRKYYMVVTLPEDFSKNAATVLDPDPQKLNLKYETNPGVNFLGEVISDTAMEKLKAQVNESVSTSYVKAIFSTIKTIGSNMNQAADGAQKLNGGAEQLNSGVSQLNEKVPTLASGIDQLNSGAATLNSGVGQYTGGVHQLASGINQLGSQVPTLASGVNQLDQGANSLSSAIGQYTSGTSTLSNGLNTLNAQVPALTSAIPTLNNGAQSLSQGLNQLNSAVSGEGGLAAGVAGLAAGADQLSNGLSADKVAALNQYADGVINLANGLESSNLTGTMAQIKASLTSIGQNLQAAAGSLQIASQPVDKSNEVIQALASTNGGKGLTEEEKAAVRSTLKVNSSDSQVASALGQISAAAVSLQQLSASLNNSNISAPSQAQLDALKQGSTGLQGLLSQMPAGLQNLSGGLNQLNTKITADNGLAASISALSSGSQTLAGGTNALSEKVPTLASGISQLASGANQLNDNSSALKSGASTLAGGLTSLNGNIPTLAAGVSTLSNGATTLDGQAGTLTGGTAKLSGGLSELAGNLPTLTSGVSQLLGGTSQLVDGTDQLADKLKEGSAKISATNLADKNATMVAAPDELEHTKYSKVPNYGHALAPYFMSVSLYVGALVFNFAYPIRKIARRKDATAYGWFSSKVVLGALVSTSMALIIGITMQLLGLTVESQVQYFGILLATSWAYMFLVMFLAMTLDNPGRFLAMLLLVLQLGSAGGMFPMQVVGKFYNFVHSFVPMTYSIYGLRQAISGGLGNGLYVSSLTILLVLAVVLIGFLYLSMKKLFKEGQAGYSQLDQNQKLMDDDYSYDEKYTFW
ncbi:YhgE/Pip domain-containing protein [Streptococcaceae bacterium ESL0687]|nr:YhgE/Pip domain-containing protein [Streptococcaceae bacterium ESL0687]